MSPPATSDLTTNHNALVRSFDNLSTQPDTNHQEFKIISNVGSKLFSDKSTITIFEDTTRKIKVVDDQAIRVKVSEQPNKLDEKMLGTGAFGSVYLGLSQNEHSQQEIAVKKIEYNNNKIMFQDEVNALLALRHQDNIVQILGAIEGISKPIFYIFMERGDLTLRRYISKMEFTLQININFPQLVSIATQMFSATLTCINFCIFNTDIQIDNFLIFYHQKMIKMIDFGILNTSNTEEKSKYMMLEQTIYSLLECIIQKSVSCDEEITKNLKRIIARYLWGIMASSEEKIYMLEHISPYFHNNPLLIKLVTTILTVDSSLSDIDKLIASVDKIITDIKQELEMQPLTEIRDI